MARSASTVEITKFASPNLRFPEFQEDKGWKLTPLSEVLSESGLKSDGRSEVHSVSLTSGVVPQVEHMGRSYAAADTSHYSLVRPFDVVYTRSPLAIFRLGIVKQHRRPHNAIVSPLYGVFTPANKYVGQLVEAFFDSPARSVGLLDPLAQKGAKNTIHLTNDRFLAGRIYLPQDEREQQKLADCLTLLEKVIAAQGRKVEALKAHKKGLMQHLFPQEGQTLPRLRFPEFRDGSEWEEKSVAQLGNTLPGLSGKSAEDFGVGEPYVTYKQVFDSPIIDWRQCAKVRVAPGERQTRLQYGDMLFTGSSETPGEVGWASTVLDDSPAPMYLNSFCFVLRPKDRAELLPEFSRFLFHSPQYRAAVQVLAQGAIRYNISKAGFLAIRLRIPGNPAEQQRIADCLSSLDARLAADAARLDALKAHKTGLMQGLFPAMEEHA